MPEYVRVKDKATKHEKSLPVGASLDGWEVLKDRDAVSSDGTPLPDKPHVSLSNQSGQKAEPKKES